MAADTFAEVPKYEDWAADEGPVCRRVVEVLRLDGIEEVASLVDEYLMAVHEFGKPGFFARAWKLRKYVGTRLDEKLCTMLPGARLIPYKLEAALRKFSDCGDDAFDANEGGIDLEELRTAFEELHQEEKVPLEETQLIRAIERFDEAAVRYADEKMSAVMAETTSLTVYAKGLVLRLLVAAFADDTKTIETIMEVAPNIVSCATHVAAMRGNTNAIMKLKDMKGDFTIPDGRHRTPLHHAAAHGHAKVVSYLLLHCQVNVDAKDHSDRTALMRASFEGFLDVVICLVDVGKADVNIGYGDEAAIDLALRRGHIEVVKYLETRGARRPSAPTYTNKLLGASRAVKKKCNIEEELQLCREALLMVELGTHPHIVSLHQCVVSNSDFLLFTTLVDGARNLETLVSSGDLYNADTGIAAPI
ncbi:hypothetical protein CTAYLR_005624 [Chrysophaeum taylorii]|uniref:Uncharacterized protein n=1 Tax=Chrysophaeum taylorii TaxID=2483200 RepID=A0AAD7XG02_9STRA|nr:hypothetical protein CTAYLR_005624 [Chrysophaeum taylorii]